MGISIRHRLRSHAAELRPFRYDPQRPLDERIDVSKAFMAKLDKLEISGWGWPQEYGGRGGPLERRAELYDALTCEGYGLPEQVAALEVMGSALLRFSPTLSRRHMPAMLQGHELWCQGFSEPEAGSDLASLRMTATPSGADWVLNGQKVWTSLGHRARWCGVLARTGPPGSRHRGLTLFWVDMQTPGVTVRPLRTLTGDMEFAEVFYEGVAVPGDSVVGEVDGGWQVAMYLLQYERGMWAWQRQALMHAMLDEVVHAGVSSADLSRRLGEAVIALTALRLRCHETVTRLGRGEAIGPEVSVDKLLLSTAEHIVNEVVRHAEPSAFVLSDQSEAVARRQEWFYSRAATIYGGSREVQKNILADRVLELPRE
jgi:acyl-CoA dehydrogenase